LRKADIIYSRDYDGVEYTRNLLGLASSSKGKIRFCYDVGFILDPVRPTDMNLHLGDQYGKQRPVIGLNVSGLLYMGGYTRNNMFGLKLDYHEFIAALIDFMIRKKNATVVLVPHVFGTHAESDAVVSEQIHASLKERYIGRLLVANGTYNQNEIKHIIGLCDFFIGSRLHACIAALSQNIPTVSIAYSSKFIGVMQTIGVEGLVADPRTLGKDEILAIIDNAFEQRALLRRHLEDKIPHVKQTVLNLFSEVGPLQEVR
jgi:polysaccharide pyruvyl transferase WcaK-like protein